MDNNVAAHIKMMDSSTRAILNPFIEQPSVDDWIRDVLLAYFNYFLNIGEENEVNLAAKKTLQTALKPLVPVGTRRSLDRIEEFLYHEFRRKGFYFLGGKTGPYYGPYLWKRTEKHVFDVELLDRYRRVNVFFMHDFLIRSWMHFKTFGKHGAGGWVKKNNAPWEDGLYCVAAAYDIEHLAENLIFQVSLLKHEAQHFTDMTDFPDLPSADLEYRAKLVEVIYFPEMKYRFTSIIREADPIKADPHRYAAYVILQEASKRLLNQPYVKDEELWHSLPYEKIQAEAHNLLQEHTQRLNASPRNRKGII